jgi:hypothetical protein
MLTEVKLQLYSNNLSLTSVNIGLSITDRLFLYKCSLTYFNIGLSITDKIIPV